MARGRPPRLSEADKTEMRRYREAGVSIEHIAGMWRCGRRRVLQILAEQREKFGPENIREDKRHLVRIPLGDRRAKIETNTSSDTSR